MDRSLHAHLIDLEVTVQSLRDRLTDPRLTAAQLEATEASLQAAELALAYYRKAHDLEEAITGMTPTPSTPECPTPENPNSKPDEPTQKHRRLARRKRAGQTSWPRRAVKTVSVVTSV